MCSPTEGMGVPVFPPPGEPVPAEAEDFLEPRAPAGEVHLADKVCSFSGCLRGQKSRAQGLLPTSALPLSGSSKQCPCHGSGSEAGPELSQGSGHPAEQGPGVGIGPKE